MLTWISENIGTIFVCAVLIAIVTAIIVSMVRKKKQGKSVVCNCGNCKTCAMSGSCHKSS
ncbi:FeoB-associated Cys-rich membrane protein [Ruminococcus difficilis]|uniref:FeoB-associated Cys-rich membrane protein n=1 Tax=Ruminococcus difficilis TaxID=2763069 RepID=A0A935C413_9FIRM|nr:FeoB-associated Cys-rich membrane protein [Ruminococcus difficilis]MBK6090044.1 FeoB-associated Cys-rich membrane protein [Ruminococcus difficilis]